MKPHLSILTPAIWSRVGQSETLAKNLADQAAALPGFRYEHLVLFDNRAMTIGEKRQALFASARGRYVAFCDDDDAISPHYLSSLAEAIGHGADVITFLQRCVINGALGEVFFHVNHLKDEPFTPGGVARRRPWHVCAWRRELVADCEFLFNNYGEDAAWVAQAAPRARVGVHIPRILHTYHHSAETTAAPAP
jgi:glycosyltransferase involved in cell wall biosynthesis